MPARVKGVKGIFLENFDFLKRPFTDRFFIQFWDSGWNRMRWRVMTPALQSPEVTAMYVLLCNTIFHIFYILKGRLPSFRLPDKNKVSNLWVSLIPKSLNLTFAYLYNKYINPSYYCRTTAMRQSPSALW